MIEHYPALVGWSDAEHFDEVWMDAGRPHWRRLHPDTLTALLGTDVSDQPGGN